MLAQRNKKKKELNEKINLLINLIEKSNLKELVYILGNKKEIILRNTIAGVFRGIGIGIRCNIN